MLPLEMTTILYFASISKKGKKPTIFSKCQCYSNMKCVDVTPENTGSVQGDLHRDQESIVCVGGFVTKLKINKMKINYSRR